MQNIIRFRASKFSVFLWLRRFTENGGIAFYRWNGLAKFVKFLSLMHTEVTL